MIDQNKIKKVFGDDASLSFYQYSRQYYGDQKLRGVLDELMIGVYHESGGCAAEFSVECVEQSRNPLRLSMFDDSWKLFPYLGELFEVLADLENSTIDTLVHKLIALGFIDKSDRQSRT